MTKQKKEHERTRLDSDTPYRDLPVARRIFAVNFRKARKDLQLSQVQVSELTGLGHPYISEVERGLSNISLDNLAKLADTVRRPLWRLLKPNDAVELDESEPLAEKPAARSVPARKAAVKRPGSKK